MNKHFRYLLTFYYFFQFCLVLIAQETPEPKELHGTDSIPPALNSDLITKDEKGTKISLLVKPVINDVLRYTINSFTLSTEKSPETDDKKITSTEDINYFYSEEVMEISPAGIITYKIKFDSIIVISTDSSDPDGKRIYNSNMKNYVWHHPEFIHFSSFIHEEFFARVSSKGELTSIYGLEKMYENLFSAWGDTLNSNHKEALKNSFDQEYFISIFQPQFQFFPEKAIYEDSGWVRSYEKEITIFPVKNEFKYRLNNVKQNNDQYFINVEAAMSTDVLEKKIKDEQLTYELENSSFTGKGNYEFNMSKGCLVSKHTDMVIELNLKISEKKDSIRTYNMVKQTLSINLLQ